MGGRGLPLRRKRRRVAVPPTQSRRGRSPDSVSSAIAGSSVETSSEEGSSSSSSSAGTESSEALERIREAAVALARRQRQRAERLTAQRDAALWAACGAGRAGEVLRLVLPRHTAYRSPRGATLLHRCAEKGNVNCAGVLLRAGPGFVGLCCAHDGSGRTPAQVAHAKHRWLLAHLLDAAVRPRRGFQPEWGPRTCPICSSAGSARSKTASLSHAIGQLGWPWSAAADAEAAALGQRVREAELRQSEAEPEAKRRREAQREADDRRRQGPLRWELPPPEWAPPSAAARGGSPPSFERNERRFADFGRADAPAAAAGRALLADDLPWPELRGGQLPVPDDARVDPRRMRRLTKALWMRWHPDKFLARFGSRLQGAERDVAAQRCKHIAQLISEL